LFLKSTGNLFFTQLAVDWNETNNHSTFDVITTFYKRR
jgi:hypothetical protein